jgi:hypothetical protein
MSRGELSAALAIAAASPDEFPEARFEGRGIVICAGGPRLFTCAWICIGMLRQLGCTLPIEVWFLGPREMSMPMRGLLAELGVDTIDAFEVARRHRVRRLGGWELKPYALRHSRFRQVLLLDADNVPVRDPSDLFDHPAFQTAGALFWPDLLRLSRANPIWRLAGLPPRDCPSFESGQLLLDKSRCWRALGLAHWMNQRSDEFYRLLHGDKDTFLIAWLMLAQPYHLVPHPPKQLEGTLCQRDPSSGAVLFQHRNGAKWVLQGENPAIEGFRFEAECFALLATLGERWDGHVFHPPARSPAAIAIERELAEARRFSYVRVTSDERSVELLPDHRIGGTPGESFYWHVEDDADGLAVVLSGNGAMHTRLRRTIDGSWRGELLHPPYSPTALIRMDPLADLRPVVATTTGSLDELLERALAQHEMLPGDGDTLRDLAGFLRTLANLDPSVRPRLDVIAASGASPARARLIQLAFDGWSAPSDGPAGGDVAPGHGWNRHAFPLSGYDPGL